MNGRPVAQLSINVRTPGKHFPVRGSRTVWKAPAAIAVTVLRESAPLISTATGVVLLLVVPLPSCPELFWPQANTFPSEVSTSVWELPEAIAVTVLPESAPLISTATGVVLLLVVPLPRYPLPQAKSFPSEVSATVCWLPSAIAVTVLPESAPLVSTATGVMRLIVVPSPSCPD